jgi:YfiH family protein
MIEPPDSWGIRQGRAIFSDVSDGDSRGSIANRRAISERLGVPADWASVSQVHGARVMQVSEAGDHGEADALWTANRDLPVAVFTADCLGIVLYADAAVGVAHAGWSGLASGVIQNLIEAMASAGYLARAAAIGPAIGPCCYEVGPEVVSRFAEETTKTTWDTTSVNLWVAATRILGPEIDVWSLGQCTRCNPSWFSHRRDGSLDRQVSLAWLE